MHRFIQPCLLSVLTGALLLVPICWGQYEDSYDNHEATGTPDYDYNTTFEYTFFSNDSSDELDKFLTKNDIGIDMGEEESTVVSTTDSDRVFDKGSRMAPPCFLFTLGFTAHQLVQHL
ncbi:hypothetical protein DPEC_G00202280 [Dallia pectoralis]|uniref:Uncharacterized protein n=1 Tax=Dallia pectoralis TaxID=75939 RepID=A0ACC2G9C6_DALPE|nr:hypothetical protein DPEC_G00202280 [Dallia pectoralis]